MKACRLPRRAYTLVELLLVVSIVAMLASLLFPAFQTARQRAKEPPCIANLRQIGAAVAMYTQDFDDLYPNGADTVHRYSYLWKPPQEEADRIRTSPILRSILRGYVREEQVWRCPSDRGLPEPLIGFYDADGRGAALPRCDSAFGAFGTSYLYHLSLAVREVRAPASAGYTSEANPAATQVGAADIAVLVDVGGNWHRLPNDPTTHVNLLFADGHCAAAGDAQFFRSWLVQFP